MTAALDLLDRPGRHLHRHRRSAPDGRQIVRKLLSDNPERYARRGGGRDQARSWPRPAAGRSARSRWAPPSPPTPCSSARASRWRWRSPPGSATRSGSATRRGRHLRAADRAARAALWPCHRGGRAGDRRGRGAAAARRGRGARGAAGGVRRGLSRARDRADARLALDRARGGAGAKWRGRSASPRFRRATRSSPLIKLIGRGDTAVVDAYLSPVLRLYVDKVVAGLGGAGGACSSCSRTAGSPTPGTFRGKDAILSGPAGGIVGMAQTAAAGRVRPFRSASTWAAPRPTSPICRRL